MERAEVTSKRNFCFLVPGIQSDRIEPRRALGGSELSWLMSRSYPEQVRVAACDPDVAGLL